MSLRETRMGGRGEYGTLYCGRGGWLVGWVSGASVVFFVFSERMFGFRASVDGFVL